MKKKKRIKRKKAPKQIVNKQEPVLIPYESGYLRSLGLVKVVAVK